MIAALKLIVVGLTVANFLAVSPVVSGSALVQNVEETLFDQSSQHQAQRNNYIYTPGIGSHKVHTQATTWNSARRTCEKEGGHLAIINSVAESEVIGQLLRNSRPHNGSLNSNLAHIGIHDLYEEDDWVTIHGESVADMEYSIWQPGEPDDTGNLEHCGSVFLNGKAVDTRCTGRLGFICEKPDIVTLPPSDQQMQIDPRSRSTTERNDYTYTPGIGSHKVHTQATTWNSARRTCEKEGGHLAIINSVAESEVIGQLLRNSRPHNGSSNSDFAYIGIHELYEEDDWVTIHGESVADMEYSIWQPGEPDKRGNLEHCGSAYLSGKAVDTRCTRLLGFICEKPDIVTPAPSDQQVPVDPRLRSTTERNDYTYTPGIGYHKVHTQATTWNSARRTCEKEGGHLAIINSVAESEVIGQLLRNSRPHNGSSNSNIAHIGIHELYEEDDWVTIHGESVADMEYSIWRPGEPDKRENLEHCGSVYLSGKAVDTRCTGRLGFICEKPDIVTLPPSDQQVQIDPRSPSTTERNDYTYTPNIGAHKVHTQATNWNSARKICQTEGGHLAIVNSGAESELIARLVANSGSHNGSADSDFVHMGFHDLFTEGQFVTVNGESIEEVGFNEWADGEPNNGSGNENCGSIKKNGKLNDVNCAHAHGFVCELPYVPPNLQRAGQNPQ